METPAIIELRNINKSFYGVKALNGMNFAIEKGEMRSLIGENGCGKSTMIKIISGVYQPDDGEILINGKPFRKLTPLEAMQQGIHVIYQDFALFPNLTVAENITMSRFVQSRQRMMDWKATEKLAKEQLEQLNINLDCSRLVADISVAQRQIVAICRALIQNARLIIMDEPTTALTHKEIVSLYAIVKDLLARGISVLFVSHKLDEVATISNNVTIMRNGQNVFEGPTAGLGKEKMIYYMTGREIKYETYEADVTDERPVLRVEDFSNGADFRHVNFSLYRREVLGITGLMGCGRSEIAKALFGLLPHTGNVFIEDKPVKLATVRDAERNGVAYVPEDRYTEGLHMERSIGENSLVCVLDQLRNRLGLLDGKKMNQKREELLSSLTIEGMEYNKEVRLLSGGNQQKVLLVKWLGTEPDIMIFNCPTVGVDVGSKSDIHALIRSIARDGIGVIVISDDIPEIMQVCNRVLIVKNGEIAREVQTRDTTIDELEAMLIEDVQAV